MNMIRIIVTAGTAMALAACSSAAPHATAPSAPSPASIAAVLGCQLAPYADVSQQDAYDTVAYDSLTAKGDSSSLCTVGTGDASDVITFASETKEDDWLHQNDLAQTVGVGGTGYVELVEGPLWVVTSGSGVVGGQDLVAVLARLGGREVTTF